MGNDRTWKTWLIRKNMGNDGPLDGTMGSIVGPDTDPVSVVEEQRLREAEAERDTALSFHEAAALLRLQEAEARAERLEAELREAREALADVVRLGTTYQRYLHRQLPGQPPPDPRYHDEPVYSPEADRARGVLEKGDTGAGG